MRSAKRPTSGVSWLRYHVRARTRLRGAARRLWHTRAIARLRGLRARANSRRVRARIAALNELSCAPSSEKLTPPHDTRGVLQAEPSTRAGAVDVVVCVHDALEDVHRCVASVLEASERPLRLIVVDDGSGPATAEYLDRLKEANPAVELHRTPGPAHGYTIAANVGLRASTAEHVVLLNSDTIVTRGWLDRMLAATRADEAIGIVGPLSNAASHQSVPKKREDGGWAVNELPSWLTSDGMAELLAHLPGEDTIPVPFLNGFCYCIARKTIDAVGLLDEERFADGYSEENDFSVRAADAGFALAVAPRAYVAHAKSRSYGREGRNELAKRNYGRFLEKHGKDRVEALVAELEESASLATLRERVAEATRSPQGTVAQLPQLRVTFVLPGIATGGSGGSHSIYQEAMAMRTLGLPARIAVDAGSREQVEGTYPQAGELFAFYEDDEEFSALLDGDDIAVATHFSSAAPVAHVVAKGSVRRGAYYVQDYEPLFVPDGSSDAAEASASYRLISDAVLFAKTDWVRQTLHEYEGVAVAKVAPSLDRDLFHARGRSARDDCPVHITAMLRPRTPRRAPRETLDVLGRIAKRYGQRVRITTFGCTHQKLASLGASPSAAEHRGLLSREGVADLMREADVFLDCSWYQAFGRTSLEAMACGATSVLPRTGGAGEFARHKENALLVDTEDREATCAAVARLVEDPALLRRLQASARETATRYSTIKAALSEYALFCHALTTRPHDPRVDEETTIALRDAEANRA